MKRLFGLVIALILAHPAVSPGQGTIAGEETREAALGVLRLVWSGEVQAQTIHYLQAGDPELRFMAAETLGLLAKRGDRRTHEALVHILNDEDRHVRAVVILAIARIGAEGAADVLANVLQFDDGKDKALRAALVRGIDVLGKPAVMKLAALADSGEAAERDRAVEAFLALRCPAGADALPILLKNYHLTRDQKDGLLRSLKNYPLEVKQLISWLDQKDPQFRLAVIQIIADRRILQAIPRLEKLIQEPSSAEEGRATAKALDRLRQDR